MNNRNRSLSIEFRQQEVGYVMERWRANDSCSLVGVGSVGKSNLLQHLANETVQSFYMKDIAGGKVFKAITIDPSMLGPLPITDSGNLALSCWAGYELMMHRMFLAFYPFDFLSEDDSRLFYETYQALQDGNNPLYAYMGLRYFELGLDLLMKQGVQIVFMFDEFEEMLKQLPVKFFVTLRGLRDANKKQLSYLTFTRSPLAQLVNKFNIDPLNIEPFTELFNDNLIYVGPYNEIDARNMVNELTKRNDRAYESYAIDFILWASGRYAGLLRSSFKALDSLGTLDANIIMTRSEMLLEDLASRRAIRSECETIWKSLSKEEQLMLREFRNMRPNIDPNDYDTQQTFALLQQKQLLQLQGNKVIISPPLFQSYIRVLNAT